MKEVIKEKVYVLELKPGMFVCELDRPWIETPFLFQGFRIHNEEDIVRIGQHCRFVYIDVEKSIFHKKWANPGFNLAVQIKKRIASRSKPVPYASAFEDEIDTARDLQKRAKLSYRRMCSELRIGRPLNPEVVSNVVFDMVQSVLRNPDALLLLSNLEEKDEFATTHAINVCILSLAFGRHLGFDEKRLRELGLCAMLHDVGETRLPEEILEKGGNLTPNEFELMKTHTNAGAEILAATNGLPASCAEVAHSHHERMNGSGYPQGLNGNRISQFTKVVSIVDVYDSVTSTRVGNPLTSVDALKTMYNWRNELFDAELVESFIQCIGIYPIGSVVELSTGEVGIIIAAEADKRLAPKVMLVRDADKRPYFPPHVVDLSMFVDRETQQPPEIKRVLEPNAYGIDLKGYLLREMPIERLRRVRS